MDDHHKKMKRLTLEEDIHTDMRFNLVNNIFSHDAMVISASRV